MFRERICWETALSSKVDCIQATTQNDTLHQPSISSRFHSFGVTILVFQHLSRDLSDSSQHKNEEFSRGLDDIIILDTAVTSG